MDTAWANGWEGQARYYHGVIAAPDPRLAYVKVKYLRTTADEDEVQGALLDVGGARGPS